MANWVFWYVYITVAYIMISSIFIWINWFAIKVHYELWRGRKFICIWKRGQVITDWDIKLREDKYGIKKGDKTFKLDDRKGLRFKRLPVHIFDEDNIAELDFSDKNNIYPPESFDPVVFQKVVLRALASGVNDNPYLQWIIIGLVGMLIMAVLAGAGAYLGYQNYVLLHDFLVNSGILKL